MVQTVTREETLAEAQRLVDRWPARVTRYRRKAFDREMLKLGQMVSFDLDGHRCLVTMNYMCEGPYRPEQEVTFTSWSVTVWSTKNCLVSETGPIRPGGKVLSMTKTMIKKVDRACAHEEAVAIGGRMCLTKYRCKKCGAVYEVDSSD